MDIRGNRAESTARFCGCLMILGAMLLFVAAAMNWPSEEGFRAWCRSYPCCCCSIAEDYHLYEVSAKEGVFFFIGMGVGALLSAWFAFGLASATARLGRVAVEKGVSGGVSLFCWQAIPAWVGVAAPLAGAVCLFMHACSFLGILAALLLVPFASIPICLAKLMATAVALNRNESMGLGKAGCSGLDGEAPA